MAFVLIHLTSLFVYILLKYFINSSHISHKSNNHNFTSLFKKRHSNFFRSKYKIQI